MAVVQISKIQVRRGLKNSNTGVPQLSSAEFAWAVDSQELFIGNGSVAEGAPFVGNTKILTENDNILELAGSYQFAAQDPTINYSIARSLQTKIDEISVSIADFGAIGDGSSSSNSAVANAVEDLFKNTDPRYKKVLLIPNGEFVFTDNIVVPSTTIIRGETADGAVLNIGSWNIVFVTEDGLENDPGIWNSTNQPRNIQFSNLTIQSTQGQVVLSGIRDSVLSNVIFKGEYVLGDAVDPLGSRTAAVYWENTSTIQTRNITFDNCRFESLELAMRASQSTIDETEITVSDCRFIVNANSIFVSGVVGQLSNWTFRNNKFEEVYEQVFYADQGRGYLFDHCDFKNCSNGVNNASNPSAEIIYFGDYRNNRVIDCTSNRHQNRIATTNEDSIGFYPEVVNAAYASFTDRQYADIVIQDALKPLAVFSSRSKFIYISYSLKLSSYTRAGKLTLTTDYDFNNVAITDEYQYSPNLLSDPGGLLMTNFTFDAALTNKTLADSSANDTILLTYSNPVSYGVTGTISYQISYGV